MPIRAENRARYPKNWSSEIVPRIRQRSQGRCECTGQCGEAHEGDIIEAGRCDAYNGLPHPVTESTVVLTVMHLDHQPENCDDSNLLHGCQRCHNRYDAPMRRAGIKRRAREALGIVDLSDDAQHKDAPARADHERPPT